MTFRLVYTERAARDIKELDPGTRGGSAVPSEDSNRIPAGIPGA